MNEQIAYAPQFGKPRADESANTAPMTLSGLVASVFSVSLREKLDADTGGDRADAPYTWGM
jgi:hypothetical protein